MKTLTQDQILHLAKLANLTLSETEIKLYQKQLTNVLDHINQLKQIDTKSVEPTYQAIGNLKNLTRPDKIKKSLSQKQALSQAKNTKNGYFIVPKIL
jgi:aspartyl-tRNA(Asn)/glutamyl-tRNA(Gln) amidotransferase subunit C